MSMSELLGSTSELLRSIAMNVTCSSCTRVFVKFKSNGTVITRIVQPFVLYCRWGGQAGWTRQNNRWIRKWARQNNVRCNAGGWVEKVLRNTP